MSSRGAIKYTYAKNTHRDLSKKAPPKTKSQLKNQNKRKAARKNAKKGKEMTDEEWDRQTENMNSVPLPTKLPKKISSDEHSYLSVLNKVMKDPELIQTTKITSTWVSGTIPPSTIKKMSWADIDELSDDEYGHQHYTLEFDDEGYDSW